MRFEPTSSTRRHSTVSKRQDILKGKTYIDTVNKFVLSSVVRSPLQPLGPSVVWAWPLVFTNLRTASLVSPILRYSYKCRGGMWLQTSLLAFAGGLNLQQSPASSLNPFRIRTCKKWWGEVQIVNQLGLPHKQASNSLPGSKPAGPLRYGAHGARIGPGGGNSSAPPGV